MKIVEGSWSVVVVGKWNRYILTPSWVGENIFKTEKIEVHFPVSRPDLAPKYISNDNIIFLPGTHKSLFIAQEPYDDEMLIKICDYTRKLVSILKHTPVTAFGTNFAFEEKSHSFKQLALFNLFESDKLSEEGLRVDTTEINRQFPLEDHFLNLKVMYKQDSVKFEFNFHYDVKDPDEVAHHATDQLLINHKNKALEIMKNVYELELEIDEEEN